MDTAALAAHFVATASGAPASAAVSTEAAMASAHRAAALLDAQPAADDVDDDWSGDEEGPASAFAMLELSAGLFGEA